jgi:hypothetical protein
MKSDDEPFLKTEPAEGKLNRVVWSFALLQITDLDSLALFVA